MEIQKTTEGTGARHHAKISCSTRERILQLVLFLPSSHSSGHWGFRWRPKATDVSPSLCYLMRKSRPYPIHGKHPVICVLYLWHNTMLMAGRLEIHLIFNRLGNADQRCCFPIQMCARALCFQTDRCFNLPASCKSFFILFPWTLFNAQYTLPSIDR